MRSAARARRVSYTPGSGPGGSERPSFLCPGDQFVTQPAKGGVIGLATGAHEQIGRDLVLIQARQHFYAQNLAQLPL